ncbi:MAG: DUF1566 domain-containing protein [Verrucomicrobiota bacterium]|jgi:hypothetical protein
MKTFIQILVAMLAAGPAADLLGAAQTYTVVATGQSKCYDNRNEIAPPKPGQPFYGQDAQFQAHPPSYALSADGLTVHDNNTDLTWQRSPDTDGDGLLTWRDKLTLAQAQALPAKLNAARFGGFDDWRLPSIKEQFSLFDARGTDPIVQGNDTSALRPFLDTNFFKFAYGDTSAGERIIDSQYASSTKYVGQSARAFGKLFGVNFADGRIKGYDLFMPGGGMEKTFFVLCARGNPDYGKNDFHDNADRTITDRATGLMWCKADSGQGMNWQDALAWVQKKNAEKFLGHDDWRLPSVKELQSIVDYTRSPDTTHSPAIALVFNCTTITNEAGQADFPFYWSATTHAGPRGGGAAMYVAFGRAAGWMSQQAFAGGPPDRRGGPGSQGGFHLLPPLAREQLNLTSDQQKQLADLESDTKARLEKFLTPQQMQQLNQMQPQRQGGPRGGGRGMDGPGMDGPPEAGPQGSDAGDYHLVDVNGAGAQRSDPKAGDPAMFPHGRGPQGDVIRIYNYVRLVRGGLN